MILIDGAACACAFCSWMTSRRRWRPVRQCARNTSPISPSCRLKRGPQTFDLLLGFGSKAAEHLHWGLIWTCAWEACNAAPWVKLQICKGCKLFWNALPSGGQFSFFGVGSTHGGHMGVRMHDCFNHRKSINTISSCKALISRLFEQQC